MTKSGYATKSDIKRLEQSAKSDMGKLRKCIKNHILNSEVKILGELQKMREENATHQYSHMRINDDLIEHDDRLKKVESALQI